MTSASKSSENSYVDLWPHGQVKPSRAKEETFTLFAEPKISHIKPGCATVGTSTSIKVYGRNLIDTGQVVVTFQANFDERLLQISPATVTNGVLTCDVPHNLPPGSYFVRASLSDRIDNNSLAKSPNLFDIIRSPTFLHVSPSFGHASGGTLLRIAIAPHSGSWGLDAYTGISSGVQAFVCAEVRFRHTKSTHDHSGFQGHR